MDLDYASRVLMRLRPFVRDGVIRRTRLERVLGTLDAPSDEVRPEVERLLSKGKIRIEEDQPVEPSRPAPRLAVTPPDGRSTPSRPRRGLEPIPLASPPGNESEETEPLDSGDRQVAVEAARARITADRHVTNLASILLTAQQEVGLAVLIRGRAGSPLKQGEFASLTGESREAAVCLFLHNQRLVHSVAKKYPQTGLGYEDVVQHGMTGLIRAVELFDPAHGNKFSTYAMWWIRQSITRGIANDARLIRLPVHMVERLNRVWATRSRLTVGGRPPLLHDLAQACELHEKDVLECLRLGPPDLPSLDMKIGDGATTLGDVLDKADPELEPFRQIEYLLLQEQMRAVLDTLSEREAAVISMRFGLTAGEQMTLDEIGKAFGVTRERIRQIESRSLTKLRHRSRSALLAPYLYGGRDRPPSKPKPAKSETPEPQEVSGEIRTGPT